MSVGFSIQEYWSGLPCPPSGDLPNPRFEPLSLTSPALTGGFFTTSTTWEAPVLCDMYANVCVHAQTLQLHPTLCNPLDCSPPGSSVHGILQARILEWIAMPSSRDVPNPGIKPMSPESPALQVDSVLLGHRGSPFKSDPSG